MGPGAGAGFGWGGGGGLDGVISELELEGKLQERYLRSRWHWGRMVGGSRLVIRLVRWLDAGLDAGESARLGLHRWQRAC